MHRSLTLAVALGLSMVTSAMAQNAGADAKKACENFNVLGATGDAAKLVSEFYTSNAMFIGPAPVAGILIGHEAIQKSYEGNFKTFKAISASCENVEVLSDAAVAISGHWMIEPKDQTAAAPKGTYAITFVKEGDKWLAAVDSWNIDLPSSTRQNPIAALAETTSGCIKAEENAKRWSLIWPASPCKAMHCVRARRGPHALMGAARSCILSWAGDNRLPSIQVSSAVIGGIP